MLIPQRNSRLKVWTHAGLGEGRLNFATEDRCLVKDLPAVNCGIWHNHNDVSDVLVNVVPLIIIPERDGNPMPLTLQAENGNPHQLYSLSRRGPPGW